MWHSNIVNADVFRWNSADFDVSYGFITFGKTEEAQKARESLNLSVFAGRRILVHYAREHREPRERVTKGPKEPSNTLFIGNLHYDLSDTELNELFRPLQNIRDVRVSIDRRTGQPRGFAHADFIDIQSAQVAFKQLNGRELKGRVLRCDYGFTGRGKALEDFKKKKTPSTEESSEETPKALEESAKEEDVQRLDSAPEGSQEPPQFLADQPEEQLKQEVEKTPEDQTAEKSKQWEVGRWMLLETPELHLIKQALEKTLHNMYHEGNFCF